MSAEPVSAFEELSALQRATFLVGNAGDEVVKMQYNGHIYHWEPLGTLPIKDQMNYPYLDTKKKHERNVKGQTIVENSSYDVVKALFAPMDGFRGADNGLYLIKGDHQDEDRRRIARARYIEKRVIRAEAFQARWAEMIENTRPGEPRPIASPELRADLEFLARYRAGHVDRKKFWSKFEDFESDDRKEVIAHLKRVWPEQWRAKGENLVMTKLPIDTKDKTPKLSANDLMTTALGPKPEESEAVTVDTEKQAQWIIAKAKSFGAKLSQQEIDGLMAGDETTMDAVIEKLSPLEAAAREKEKSHD